MTVLAKVEIKIGRVVVNLAVGLKFASKISEPIVGPR